jgi:tetratricopeptide (TPR) repeat protein
VTPEQPADPEQAVAWLRAESWVLLAAVDLAGQTGFETHAWQLAWALSRFLARQARWRELAAAHRTALQAATRLGSKAGQASALRGLGLARLQLGAPDEALALLRLALGLYHDLADPFGCALAHVNIAMALTALQGYTDQELRHFQRALVLFRQAGHCGGQAIALNAIGWHHAQLGHYRQALTYCQRALTLWLEAGSRFDESGTWDSVGYALHHLGQYSEAIESYQRALATFDLLHEAYHASVVLTHMGEAHQAVGRLSLAEEAWRQALAILDDLRHPDADRVRAVLSQPELSAVTPELQRLNPGLPAAEVSRERSALRMTSVGGAPGT